MIEKVSAVDELGGLGRGRVYQDFKMVLFCLISANVLREERPTICIFQNK